MGFIHTFREAEVVHIAMDDEVASKLMALLASATDATGAPWDLVRLMNYLSKEDVVATPYHGDGELTVRVHPMFKEKK